MKVDKARHLWVVGIVKHRDEDDEEAGGRVLTTLELSAKIVYLVKLAVERKKKIEGEKAEEVSNGSHGER